KKESPKRGAPIPTYNNFAHLLETRTRILAVEKDKVPIQWPAPLRSSTEKRNTNKYYWYHRDHGHDTEECRHLKNQIEDLIRKGHLRKYVDRDAPQERRECREQASQQEEEQQKPRDEDVISFSEADYEGARLPHDDPVVMTLQVALITMKKILIDSGSSTDIMYKQAFDQLGIPVDELKPVKTPLVGFAREIVHPLRSIGLTVFVGTAPSQTQVQMTFPVVDTPSPYNAIVGRPCLNLMEA
ncbi:hypothetical protein CFOL_v3_10684, partial [Cephalotus follicularis]